ncbi:MAG TPA: diphosphate--fructose-6-phosphate 1-phosphotransferase [Polyangiaceae bacterium]|jgi:6-phosphofructokinase 1|nr:diphosphate--fructose-6-phosphate 1-phosphotransferase [Polyangiaceae bacterium]
MSHQPKKVGILVGGGPAPGINAVIGAATIRAVLAGSEVVGILDGFSNLMKGDISHVKHLSINDVSRIHFRGGSYLGIARANPTKSSELLEETILSLLRLEIDKLITIGGDDTAFSASQIERQSKGRLRVVHVPKTIDNDLDLPSNADTFGFQTARHIGCTLVENLMVDARTTSRWYFIVAMGRKAGHLALGIGKAAGATMTLIPEEFPEGHVRLQRVTDTLVGAIVKRLASGRPDGVAIIAEGLVERMEESDLAALQGVERDAHGHIRIAEIAFGEILKERVQKRLAEFGIKTTIGVKNIGYELRCADPIPYDMEYARDLGFCAAKYLLEGGNAAMVSLSQSTFHALPFDQIMDRSTGRIRVRMVDISSDRYMIARRYMLRLRKDDFEDPSELAKFASVLGISLDEFQEKFSYLVEDEPVPRRFFTSDDTSGLASSRA